MPTSLITGGAGFIASHLADRLLEAGHNVVIIDNLSTGKKTNIPAGAQFIERDIRDKKIGEIFAKIHCDFVFHFAAQKNVRHSVQDPCNDADINIIGSLNILEQAVKNKVRKCIFASTGGAIYGDATEIPTTENYPAHPTAPYGISKLATEQYLDYYRTVHKLKSIVLRLANVYGPRQDPAGEAGVIAIFIEQLLQNKQPTIFGDGKQTRDFVYVSDVTHAALSATESRFNGSVNIGTGIETSVNTLYTSLQNLTRKNIAPLHGQLQSGEQLRSCLSPLLAKRILNWQPQITLEEGLKETIQWFTIHSSEKL